MGRGPECRDAGKYYQSLLTVDTGTTVSYTMVDSKAVVSSSKESIDLPRVYRPIGPNGL